MTTTHAPVSDSRIPTDTVSVRNPTLLPVVDCPRCAWRDFGTTGLDRHFVGEHEDRIEATGQELIRRPLIEAWRAVGFVAVLVCHHDHYADASGEGEPEDDVFIAVRQAAADRMPWGVEFAAAAGLEREYADYMGRER